MIVRVELSTMSGCTSVLDTVVMSGDDVCCSVVLLVTQELVSFIILLLVCCKLPLSTDNYAGIYLLSNSLIQRIQ